MRNTYRILIGKSSERKMVVNQGVDARIIFRCILREPCLRAWTGSIVLVVKDCGRCFIIT